MRMNRCDKCEFETENIYTFEDGELGLCYECANKYKPITDKYVKYDNVHFSSKTDMWATPQDFFNKMNEEFRFELDVCATDENAKCGRYFTKEIDGLKQEWYGVCWMNPPYGRSIGNWVKKAYESSLNGVTTVVCLLPARTDTKWWHDYCMKGEIRLVKGRLKFGGSKNSAPFPSAIVIFGLGAEINTVKAI